MAKDNQYWKSEKAAFNASFNALMLHCFIAFIASEKAAFNTDSIPSIFNITSDLIIKKIKNNVVTSRN